MTTPQAGAQPATGDAAGRSWVRKDLKPGSEREPAEFTLGLASLPFVGRTLRRRAKVWLLFGFVGMLIGVGFYVKAPPPYEAQSTVWLAQPPDVDPLDAVQTDVTLAQARGVAGAALHKLRLTESVNKFLTSYTAAALTDRVVQFTVGGPTSAQAVARANALAAAFLKFRGGYLTTTQRLYDQTLKQQISQYKLKIAAIDRDVVKVKQQEPPSTARKNVVDNLQTQQRIANRTLAALDIEVTTYPVNTSALVEGSYPLESGTPLPRSHVRIPALYAVAGLIAAIAIGMGYVVAAELVTDRLRRRDDVARALGTPVRLSVGSVRTGRLPGRRGLQAVRDRDVLKMAALLRATLPPRRENTVAALAVVAVDDPVVAALPALSLAVSAARAGSQVMIADLTEGAAAAGLLGITGPGVRIVAAGGQQIALVVPERGDLTPLGPLHQAGELVSASSAGRRHAGHGPREQGYAGRGHPGHSYYSREYGGPLAAAYEASDLLLTVATLDPGLGAEHLPSWAMSAVLVVTAGRSTATKIHAVGEMLRLAELPSSGAILVGADKADISLGAIAPRAATARRQPPAGRPPTGRPPSGRPAAPQPRLGATGR